MTTRPFGGGIFNIKGRRSQRRDPLRHFSKSIDKRRQEIGLTEFITSTARGKPTPCNKLQPRDTPEQRHARNQAAEAFIKELESLEPFHILEVNFSLLSWDEVKKGVRIGASQSTPNKFGLPDDTGTVNDRQMGGSSDGEMCSKCNQNDCPGHMGYIELNEPIFNPIFMGRVIDILKVICHDCAGLLFNRETIRNKRLYKMSGDNRFKHLVAAVHKTKCVRPRPVKRGGKINKSQKRTPKGLTRSKEVGEIYECKENMNICLKISKELGEIRFKDSDKFLTAKQVLMMFEQFTAEDIANLGFKEGTHPRDLIIKYLPVVPPITRPMVEIDGVKKEDRLTKLYNEIINKNDAIALKANDETRRADIRCIYEKVYKLFIGVTGDKNPKKPQSTVLSLMMRIQGKYAYIRGNSLAKRTNYCARAVVSPDSSLRFGEAGIPRKFQSYFTVPMVVTQSNQTAIQSMLEEGKIAFITPVEGREMGGKRLRYREGYKFYIDIGTKVERYAIDGDIVVLNRQPTIQRESIMAYYIVFHDGNTINIHPSATTPHNADFDGDEVNLWFPRDINSRREAEQIMHITKCMMSDKESKPMVGLIMDSVTSAYLLTDDEEIVDEEIFYNAVSLMGNDKPNIEDLQARAVQYGLHPFAGKVLFSALLPSDLFYDHKGVLIIDGILVKGRILNDHVGVVKRSIIQALWSKYGVDKASDFITYATWILLKWLDHFGFSIGPADCEFGASKELRERRNKFIDGIHTAISELGPKVDDPVEERHRGNQIRAKLDMIQVLGKTMAEQELMALGPRDEVTEDNIDAMSDLLREGKVKYVHRWKLPADDDEFNKQLNNGSLRKFDRVKYEKGIDIKVGDLIEKDYKLGRQNAIGIMAKGTGAGSKADIFNISQIGNSLGQQFYQGERPIPTLEGKRCLPTQMMEDDCISNRGFCRNSFWEGLTPEELYFHLWGARAGLINTALSTAKVGDTYRRLLMAFSNGLQRPNGTITNTIGTIFSYSDGMGGTDGREMISTDIPGTDSPFFIELQWTADSINSKYGWVPNEK